MNTQEHLAAWADTHEGYTVKTRQAILKCLWCEYTATAPTAKEAVATYRREHEGPMLRSEPEPAAELEETT